MAENVKTIKFLFFVSFSGKVMEMSWNFTKMSWKKYVFTNSVITKIFGIISLTIMC